MSLYLSLRQWMVLLDFMWMIFDWVSSLKYVQTDAAGACETFQQRARHLSQRFRREDEVLAPSSSSLQI